MEYDETNLNHRHQTRASQLCEPRRSRQNLEIIPKCDINEGLTETLTKKFNKDYISENSRQNSNPTTGNFDSSLHSVATLKGLKIASLNVNSLIKHIDEIKYVLINFPFDIFAINESKIDESISDSEISISVY